MTARANPGSYAGELVIHSLVPSGALGPACGLPADDAYLQRVRERRQQVTGAPGPEWGAEDTYTAWVAGVAAELVPLAARYLRGRHRLDEAFVERALHTFATVFERWQHTGLGSQASTVRTARPTDSG
jgi:hypothetical protein